MSRQFLMIMAVLAAGTLFSCANKPAAGDRPHATILMRDGARITGAVVASSPAEITIAGDDSVTRTIPMKQVKAVEYGEAAAQAPAAPLAQTPAAQAPASARPTSEPRAAAPPPPREAEMPHQSRPRPVKEAIRTKTYVLPVGAEIPVRVEETIDSGKAVEGQTYAADVARDVVDAAGDVVIPRGSNAQIVIRSASKGGRIRGSSDLSLDLLSVSVEGQRYLLDTADITKKGSQGIGANKRTAEYTGGGAAVGAIIGAIAGGGKGAAIGAGAGAGGGALTQILTRGGSIKVPVETVLTFKLDKALRVVEAK